MFGPYVQFLGYRYWNWLLFLVLFLPGVFGWWGEVTARSQQTFPTFNYQGRAWAIVRVYGDRWLIREVNYSTSAFEEAFAVMQAQPIALGQTKVSF